MSRRRRSRARWASEAEVFESFANGRRDGDAVCEVAGAQAGGDGAGRQA